MAMNMKPSEVRAALITYFQDNYSETPVEFENIKFDDAAKKNPFVSFTIRMTNGRSVIRGNGASVRYSGVIFIDVRTPIMTGTKRAYEIADIVADIMHNKRINYLGESLVTEASEVERAVTNDEYYMLPVTIPFRVT